MGVPQGSVLGLLLFTLYLSDFRGVLRDCEYSYYADDLLVYYHCKPGDVTEAIDRVNDDVLRISAWIAQNQLVLNSKKTQAMFVGSSRYINALDIGWDNGWRGGCSLFHLREVSGSHSHQHSFLGQTRHNCYRQDKWRIVSVETMQESNTNYPETEVDHVTCISSP